MQHNNMLDTVVENFEVEDLQGVTGLKALRVGVLYNSDANPNETLNYNDLLKEIAHK